MKNPCFVLNIFTFLAFREQEEDRLFDSMIAAKGLYVMQCSNLEISCLTLRGLPELLINLILAMLMRRCYSFHTSNDV